MMRSLPLIGAPQPWPPPPSPSVSVSGNATDNKTYRDCTPGICTVDCRQYCGFLFFPPPPPFPLDSSDGGDDDSSGRISPLMAALIAVLAAAFLLLFYYTVVSRFCRRRRHRRNLRNLRAQILNNPSSDDGAEIRLDPMVHDPTRAAGLDESFIRQITVFKYRRSDGLIDGTDCAVCLNEFKEEENLRLMPNCEHAFHIPCIDTWLKSHSSCPLCRSTMDPLPARPGTNPNPSPNTAVSVAAMQVQSSSSSNDVILVVREVDGGDGEVVICHHETAAEEGEGGGGVGGSEERENGGEEARKGDVNQR